VALAALAVVATVAGVVGTLLQSRAARLQRDFALQQMESSEVLNEFHEFLLSDAAPSGKPFTVNDLLDRAARIVDRQHTADDPDRLRLLISIGHQYLEHDEAARARPVIEEAYKWSRTSANVSIRAKASCMLGVSVSQQDDLSRAEALFREGIAELPSDPQFALERISCLRSGAEIAVQSGNAADAVALAQTAQTVLRQSRFDSPPLESQIWIDLATAYTAADRDQDALLAFQQASDLLSSLGRDQTETAAVLFCNWGLELDLLGRPLEAEDKYKRAIQIERTGRSEDNVSPMLLADYSRTLEELGRLHQAADYATRAYSKAQRITYTLAGVFALFEIARIAAAEGDTSRAISSFELVESRMKKRFPAGHYGFAVLAGQRALIALAKGNLSNAIALANQAVSLDEAAIAAGGDGAHDLPDLLTTRSKVELAASRPSLAVNDANRAIALLESKARPETKSSILGHAYLALGHALLSQGKSTDARSAFRSAADNLKATVGPAHPDTRLAGRLAQH
jgi:tetratricopeptide (TPR) repeat protein